MLVFGKFWVRTKWMIPSVNILTLSHMFWEDLKNMFSVPLDMIQWHPVISITKNSSPGRFRKNSRELGKIIFPRIQVYNFTKGDLEHGGLFSRKGFKIFKIFQNLNFLKQLSKEKVTNASVFQLRPQSNFALLL